MHNDGDQMNARQQFAEVISSNDHVHGDEGLREYTADELARIEFAEAAVIDERVKDAEWWAGLLQDEIPGELPQQLARMMANLDRACNGEGIAMGAITAALSIVQKQARKDAAEGARDLAERLLTRGEI